MFTRTWTDHVCNDKTFFQSVVFRLGNYDNIKCYVFTMQFLIVVFFIITSFNFFFFGVLEWNCVTNKKNSVTFLMWQSAYHSAVYSSFLKLGYWLFQASEIQTCESEKKLYKNWDIHVHVTDLFLVFLGYGQMNRHNYTIYCICAASLQKPSFVKTWDLSVSTNLSFVCFVVWIVENCVTQHLAGNTLLGENR